MIAAFIAMLPREELAHSRFLTDAERETLANLAQRKANRPQHIAAGHKGHETRKRRGRV